ncbi:MAG: hypothetical protein ACO1RX_02585 [Candidatus Sericytochromatia bacterium]
MRTLFSLVLSLGLCLPGLLLGWAPLAQAQEATPTPSSAPASGSEVKVNFKADKVEYLRPQSTTRLIGNVELKVRDMTIKTERLDYNQAAGTLRSDTPFEIIQIPKEGTPPKDGKPRTLKGNSFIYDVRLRRLEASEIYLIVPAKTEGHEVYIQGDFMTAFNDGQRVVFQNGFYTTCNHVEAQFPDTVEDLYSREAVRRRATHYAVEAEILDFIDNDRVIAYNGSLLTFENQAFWFPFWYIPLQFNPGDLGWLGIASLFGQNPVEGIFAQLSSPYRINEYHDGVLYLRPMEKKGLGIGIQHDWIAAPNSISRFFFYGIPVTDTLLNSPGSFLFPPSPLQQAQGGLQTQQTTEDNFLLQAGRWFDSKFTDHHFNFQHKQLLLPNMEADVLFDDFDLYSVSGFTAPRNPQRRFEFKLSDNEIFAVDPYTDLQVTTNLELRQSLNNPQTLQLSPTDPTQFTQETRISQTQNRTASVSTKLGDGSLNLRTNWSNSFNQVQSQGFTNGQPTGSLQQQPFSGNENWNSNLDFNTALDAKTKLSANLVYNSNLTGLGGANNSPGTQQQTLQPRVQLSQSLDWGSSTLSYEDFFDLAPNANSGSNRQIKKLPELDLRFNPFFQDSFPIQFNSIVGRYFDPESFNIDNSLNEVGRTLLRLSLGSKEHDLGLGMKLNLGGTNFEQRLYQTLDAEYILTGTVNLKNDLSPYFIPILRYERTVQDEENNNSPFLNFDPLGLRKLNNLTADIRLVNLPEFTMNLTGGYDYLNRRYQPIRANILSDIGGQFSFRANSSYTPVNVTDAEVGKELQDIDRNIYKDVNTGQTFVVRPEDVGSFIPYGGRWGSTTMGFRWRNTPEQLQIGNLSTFGLDEGVPQGFEFGGDIAYDFHLGKIDALNTILRLKLGDSWLWHTEIDLTASVQPTLLPQNGQEWLGLVVPFKITVRKDLHDFVLTAAWDSFYQQFTLNLALLAFPYSTDQLTGNLGSLNQQINQINPTGGF